MENDNKKPKTLRQKIWTALSFFGIVYLTLKYTGILKHIINFFRG